MSFEFSLAFYFFYFLKKSGLVFMLKVYFDSLSFWPNELFSKRISSKSLRAINQMFIPRPESLRSEEIP